MPPLSPVIRLLTKPRSPLHDALVADAALQANLHDRGLALFVAAVPYPREAVDLSAEDLLPEIDDSMLGLLRDRRAHVLLDHAAEGIPHRPDFTRLLHAWCDLQGVPRSALIYVGASFAYPVHYHAWCDEQGIEGRYGNLNFNGFVYEVAVVGAEREGRPTDAELLEPGPREYRFLGLNNAPRPERLVMVAHLRGERQPDALVSLGSTKGLVNAERSLADVDRRLRKGRLLELHPRIFDDLSNDHLATLTTLESPSITEQPMWNQLDPGLYTRTALSVVTETGMSHGVNRRITEKSLKPFLFGHLALIAGDPGALSILRDMGFQTFDPVIDETYDQIDNGNERLCAVMCEIDRLRALGDREFYELFDATLDIRAANIRHAREVLPSQMRADVARDVSALVLEA